MISVKSSFGMTPPCGSAAVEMAAQRDEQGLSRGGRGRGRGSRRSPCNKELNRAKAARRGDARGTERCQAGLAAAAERAREQCDVAVGGRISRCGAVSR